MHIAGAIICVVIAGILVSFVVDDWNAAPTWVSGLALVTTVVLLVSAARIYMAGVRRKRVIEGPRTKIVLEPSLPSQSRERESADRD